MNLSKYLLTKIFKYFGYNAQLRKLNEEMFEVIEALILKDRDKIVEEFGDLFVVVSQFMVEYGIETEEILHTANYKVKRTDRLIDGGKYE